jgi:hypothetical protein
VHHGVWGRFVFLHVSVCLSVADVATHGPLVHSCIISANSLAKAESWEGHGRDTIVAQRHSCEPVSVSSEAAESGAYSTVKILL